MDTYSQIDTAIRAGDIDALRELFHGEDAFPNVTDPLGTCLLIAAVYNGPTVLVRGLLAAGADVNVDPADGFPSLFAAIDRSTEDRYEVIGLLLDAGADVQQRGINDYTALHYAACRDDAKAVSILLQHGADPEARTRIDDCATPLEEAVKFGHKVAAAALRAPWPAAGARSLAHRRGLP